MLLLAIESAGSTSSVALLDRAGARDRGLVAYREFAAGRQHADRLIELIEGALGDAGLDYTGLEAIAVDHGPGTFTGVRTAVAAARGLALATGLGVVAVSGLETLAWTAMPHAAGIILSALDARRGEVYAQVFADDLQPLTEPAALTPEAAARLARGPMVLVGNGAPLVRAALAEDAEARIVPGELDARTVAFCAARKLGAGARPAPGVSVQPLYLRAPDTRPPRPSFADARDRAGGV